MSPVGHVPEGVDVPGLIDMLLIPCLVLGHMLTLLTHHQPLNPTVAPNKDRFCIHQTFTAVEGVSAPTSHTGN